MQTKTDYKRSESLRKNLTDLQRNNIKSYKDLTQEQAYALQDVYLRKGFNTRIINISAMDAFASKIFAEIEEEKRIQQN